MTLHTSIRRIFSGAAALAAFCCLTGPAGGALCETIRINGSGAPLEMLKPLADAYMKNNPNIRIEINKPLGSSGAVKALLAGALDLALSSKQLKPEETAKGARAVEYGRTPLMIVTGKGGGKGSVTTRELEDIFSGRTKKWPSGEIIRPVLRPEGDIDTTILRKLSTGMDRALTVAHGQKGALVAVTDPESNEVLAKTPGSVGAAALCGFEQQKLPLTVLSLNGVAPTTRNLANGSYPLAKEIRFITTERISPPTRRFLDYALSPKGRVLAEKHGVAFEKTTAQ